jgi:hypothetical protein
MCIYGELDEDLMPAAFIDQAYSRCSRIINDAAVPHLPLKRMAKTPTNDPCGIFDLSGARGSKSGNAT